MPAAAGRLHEVRIADVLGAVGKRQPRCFGVQVQPLRRRQRLAVRAGGQRQAGGGGVVQYAQDLADGDGAAARWREAAQAVVAAGGAVVAAQRVAQAPETYVRGVAQRIHDVGEIAAEVVAIAAIGAFAQWDAPVVGNLVRGWRAGRLRGEGQGGLAGGAGHRRGAALEAIGQRLPLPVGVEADRYVAVERVRVAGVDDDPAAGFTHSAHLVRHLVDHDVEGGIVRVDTAQRTGVGWAAIEQHVGLERAEQGVGLGG